LLSPNLFALWTPEFDCSVLIFSRNLFEQFPQAVLFSPNGLYVSSTGFCSHFFRTYPV
jgi:hypothetical protein